MIIKKITHGDFNKISLEGSNRNADIGLLIDVPAGETVTIDEIEISNAFVPIIKRGKGQFFFNKIKTAEFGGDGLNIHSSNVFGGSFIASNNTPTRPYKRLKMQIGESVEQCLARHEIEVYDPELIIPREYKTGRFVIDGYHQDAIQAYALLDGEYISTACNTLRNIEIKDIDIWMRGDKAQGIAFTEACKYSRINLGERSLKIDVDYYYSIIATNLSNSRIGGAEVSLNKPIRIQNPAAKRCPHRTFNVDIVNLDGDQHFDRSARDISFLGGTARKADDSFLFSASEMRAIHELMN